MEFIEKFLALSAKMSKERVDVLKHHLNYFMRQHAINLKEEDHNDQNKPKKRSKNEVIPNTKEAKELFLLFLKMSFKGYFIIKF